MNTVHNNLFLRASASRFLADAFLVISCEFCNKFLPQTIEIYFSFWKNNIKLV